MAERVIRTIKEELLWLRDWEDAAEVEAAVAAYLPRYNEEPPTGDPLADAGRASRREAGHSGWAAARGSGRRDMPLMPPHFRRRACLDYTGTLHPRGPAARGERPA